MSSPRAAPRAWLCSGELLTHSTRPWKWHSGCARSRVRCSFPAQAENSPLERVLPCSGVQQECRGAEGAPQQSWCD